MRLPTAARRLGQVFTPRPVADWMVRWACSRMPARMLEPSLGGGVFVDAIDAFLFEHPPAGDAFPTVDAYEIDSSLVRTFRRRYRGRLTVNCHVADFLRAPVNPAYDAIVANPPYIRHHELDYGADVLAAMDDLCGRRLSRMSNVYAFFLLRIAHALAPRGRAAVITPAEWLNADFGRAIKAFLLEANLIDGIIHFEHAAKVFPNAMTTAAITLLRRDRIANEPVRFAAVASADALNDEWTRRAIQLAPSSLDPAQKWTPLFHRPPSVTRGRKSTASPARLGDIASCVRGIATGANDYFTLRESDRVAHGLNPAHLAICVTKARHVQGDCFSAEDIRRLIQSDERIYLLNPTSDADRALTAYLAVGRRLGIDRRYLPAHRPVWYRPEVRPPAPIWVSVFARGSFRFVRNQAGALNLTAYHGIYPRFNGASRMRALFAYLSGPQAQDALKDHRRIYAEGLFKLEPRDVEAIPIPADLARMLTNGKEWSTSPKPRQSAVTASRNS